MYRGHNPVRRDIYDFLGDVSWVAVTSGKPANTPRTVVDLGAHQGGGYKKLRDAYPDALIHLVEPVPDCVEMIREVVGDDPGTFIHACAVGKTDTVMSINTFSSDGRQSSNFYSDRDKKYGNPVLVPVHVKKYHFLPAKIDLAKINIEAGEYDLLDTDFFDRIETFVMEAHNNLIPGKSWRDIVRALEQKFDLVTAGDLNYKYCFVLGVKI